MSGMIPAACSTCIVSRLEPGGLLVDVVGAMCENKYGLETKKRVYTSNCC